MTKPKPVESKGTSRWVDYEIMSKPGEFLKVIKWSNGEGFDLHLSRGEQAINLTWGEFTALQAALGDRIDPPKQDAKPCPYVVSSDEGTSYCRLAEHTADQLAKLPR